MSRDTLKKPISPAKLVANRANAKRSTGPRSPEGKESSAQNARVHGFFATRLFNVGDDAPEDRAVYEALLDGITAQYQPSGQLEQFWAERIAAEMLRSLRLTTHEQKSLADLRYIASHPIDTILRCQAANAKQLELAIRQLERLRAVRKTDGLNSPSLEGSLESSAEIDAPDSEESIAEQSKSNGCDLENESGQNLESADASNGAGTHNKVE